jgi:hypothetical protein
MKRRAFAVVAGILLALSTVASAFAAPVVCPGETYPDHYRGDWYCAAGPNGEPTGAGWHRGTGEKL